MSLSNRYHKVTQGVAFELVVADSLLTSAGTTLKAFSAAGPLYRMGIFAESAIAAQPVSLATNTVIPVADRKKNIMFGYTVETDANGVYQVRHTTSCKADQCTAELIPYKAPAFQTATIVNAGVGTVSTQQRLAVKIIETTPGNIPLPVWDFDESLVLGQTAAFAKIIAKINAKTENEFFIAQAPLAPVAGAVTTASNAVTAVAITNPGSGITGSFSVSFSGGGGSGAAATANVVGGIVTSVTVTAGGSGYTSAPTASFSGATLISSGMMVVSQDSTRHFKIVAAILPTKADPSDTGVYYNYAVITNASAGSGTLAQIMDLQHEDSIRRGVGHFDPNQAMVNAEDFGVPKNAYGSTTTFDIVRINVNQTEESPTNKQMHFNKKYIYICVPVGQGANIVAMFNF